MLHQKKLNIEKTRLKEEQKLQVRVEVQVRPHRVCVVEVLHAVELKVEEVAATWEGVLKLMLA